MSKKFLFTLALLSHFVHADYYVRTNSESIDASYNSLGQTGLIHIPTAEIKKEGSVGVTIGNSSISKYASIVASPFNWLEVSFFYQRPRDTKYKTFKVGNYLDKGFNLKLTRQFSNISFALGVDDIAGTGLHSKEYIVGTFYGDKFNLTLGIGTGQFSRDHPYTNPIPGLKNRPPDLFTGGQSKSGEVDFNKLFKGPIGIFGGLEYAFRDIKGLTLKIESNPFDYQRFLLGGSPTYKSQSLRKKDKDYNIGFSYKFLDHYNLMLSQIKGNGYDLVISRSFNLAKKNSQKKYKSVKKYSKSKNLKLAFYQDLLRNLEQDELYLQSAELNNENLKIAVVNNQYNIPQDLFMHTHKVATDISKQREIEVSHIELTHIVSGLETGVIAAPTRHPLNRNKLGKINVTQAKDETRDYEFQTILKFPEFYYSLKPSFNYRYADPTRFFAGGLDLMINSEIKFSPSFYTTANFSYQLYNSFERLRYYPDSPYLPHVRTDVVKYLNNRPDMYLNNLQIDKITKLKKNHYFKLSAGMYEMMFGGFGAEYLWKPFYENYSVGINLYHVKQRDFKQQLGFSDYKTVTGHINVLYLHQKSGIYLDLSIGQYLAKDRGYTFDIGRKFRSGAKMGAYFTRTNISKEVYGEGSFDKGFYFKVPLKFLDKNAPRGDSNFVIQPLTRDGGAKLKTSNPLIYSIYGGSKIEHDFFHD